MHEIRPRLWLGSYAAASDRAALDERGVTHVLTVGVKLDVLGARQWVLLPPSEKDPLSRLVIAVQDVPSARLDRHFEACSAFISEGLAQGGAVLVHCQAGQSRSPTIVAAHLMREERLPAVEALRCIRLCRPMVQPNTGFLDQLRAFELRLGLSEEGGGGGASGGQAAPEGVRARAVLAAQGAPAAQEPLCAAHVLLEVADEGDTEARQGAAPEGEQEHEQELDGQEATDVFGTHALRLRSEKLRARCQQLRASRNLLALAAPLRKRRQLLGRSGGGGEGAEAARP